MKKIAIFGTGYVGLVSGACLAQVGNRVTCVDVDAEKIAQIQKGVCPIYEPGLEEVLAEGIASGRLTFTTDQQTAIEQNDIIMSAVGTPPGEDGGADLHYVLEVARAVGRYANSGKIMVTKSTVPPLTGQKVATAIDEELKLRNLDYDIPVVSNPEFLKEGNAVQDFLKPDRIVVGADSELARAQMEKLYKPFMRAGYKVVFMDRVSAEMTKYAANAMLATRISFMNEMARIAEKVGADIEEIRRGIGVDPRIGKAFLYAGPGYGGSCFPKDVAALAQFAQNHEVSPTLLQAVEYVNQTQRTFVIDKIRTALGGDVKGKKIALWGLAFKANTDDVRQSPAEAVIEALLNEGAQIVAHDPEAIATFTKFAQIGRHENLSYATQYEAVTDADALVIMTEWPQFRAPDFDKVRQLLTTPLIIDARNLYEPEEVRALGFEYYGVGR